MKTPLFEFPAYKYKVDDWDFKKKGLLNRIHNNKFYRNDLQQFDTDRRSAGKSYVRYFEDFLKPELTEFCKEAEISCSVTDAWCVKYQKGNYQTIHNHRGWGFSGVLYVEYDPEVHTPTCFMAPWQNPRNDKTMLSYPQGVEEGSVIIFPSFWHHYVDPNKTRKQRVVISFDLLPELPEHQLLNKNV